MCSHVGVQTRMHTHRHINLMLYSLKFFFLKSHYVYCLVVIKWLNVGRMHASAHRACPKKIKEFLSFAVHKDKLEEKTYERRTQKLGVLLTHLVIHLPCKCSSSVLHVIGTELCFPSF